jgi:hypothetical protein
LSKVKDMNGKTFVIQLFFIFIFSLSSSAQILQEWHGEWKGVMEMYNAGKKVDTVDVVLTINPINDSTLMWRTEYKSTKQPMTKDYTMRSIDVKKGIYATDEGDGVLLDTYLIDRALFNVFEVEGIMLTATYRVFGDEMIFEVTSGKKGKTVAGGVTNFSVNHLQRVKLTRSKGNLVLKKGEGVDEPAFFIEGKRISKEEMDAINPNEIEAVNVFKGEQALKQFGPTFKNGVVVIKLKIK